MQILHPGLPAILHTTSGFEPDTREQHSSPLVYLATRGWMYLVTMVIIVLAACCRPDESP